MFTKTIRRLLIIIILITILLSSCSQVFATELVNTADQYMELKVVSIEDVAGADKQITLEWWSYNLNFKGLDLRFSYDSTKVEPSNLQDNSYVTDKSSFEFAGDFASYMGYMVLVAENGEYRCVMSLDEKDDSGTYIENDASLGYIVNTNVNGGVLMGRMSFRLFSDNIDENTFALKTGATSPKTGIKIAQTSSTAYEDQSVFRFSVLSRDANLNGIQYDFFNYKEESGGQVLPELTYESLNLSNPDADSTDEISKYTINLLENLDNISLKLEKSDVNATVKINNEEIDVSNSKELVLNKLGEGDTIIEIVVTAQDGSTTHTYKLVVHKPYGTITGKVILGNGLRETMDTSYGVYVQYIATATLYQTGQFDWDGVIYGTSVLDDTSLLHIEARADTDVDDGTYTIYVMPGQYDLLLESDGFLQSVVKGITINENDSISISDKILYEGDVNRTGIIDLDDLVDLVAYYDSIDGDGTYSPTYDFGQKGFVGLDDLVSVGTTNKDRYLEIDNY